MRERWTNDLVTENVTDANGNPTGGKVRGPGLQIDWQDGPIKGSTGDKPYGTGAFVEDVMLAAILRLRFFQASKFSCRENACALTKLEEALMWMQRRHEERFERGVQGLHEK